MKQGFKQNGIYPFYMMYDTGLGEELGDLIKRAFSRSEGLFEKWTNKLQDASDKILEGIARKPGSTFFTPTLDGLCTCSKSKRQTCQ